MTSPHTAALARWADADRQALRAGGVISVASWPQRGAEARFKQGDRSQVRPSGAVENRAHSGGINARKSADVTSGTISHLTSQIDRKAASGLGASVRNLNTGPRAAERDGMRSRFSGHDGMVSPTTPASSLVSSPRAESDNMPHAGTNQQEGKTSEQVVSEFIGAHGAMIPDDEWNVIEGFVRGAVRDMNFASVRKAKNYFTACTRLAHWAWKVAGFELERQTLFRRDIINMFAGQGCADLADASRATYRSRLFQMSDALLTGERRNPRQQPIPVFVNASPPYTEREIDALKVWAKSQRTQYRSVNAAVLLALGLGAGLTTSEIISVTAGDVHIDDAGVLINVGGRRPRQVPMVAEWEPDIVSLARSALYSGLFLFGAKRHVEANPTLVTAFLGEGTRAPVRLTVQRLRATWIVGHLSNRVPGIVLARAAGFETVDSLARFAKFVPHVDEPATREMLRRSSPPKQTPGGTL